MQIIFFLSKSFISLLFIALFSGCSVNTKQTLGEDDLYNILNVFFNEFNNKVYLNPEINCCGFLRKKQPKDNIYYYLKNNEFIEKDNIDVFKSVLRNNENKFRKKIRLNFLRIKNNFVLPHSPEFYTKLKISASSMRDKKVNSVGEITEFPDINLSIFFTKDKKYSLLNYVLVNNDNNIIEKVVIFKKQSDKWNIIKTFKIRPYNP